MQARDIGCNATTCLGRIRSHSKIPSLHACPWEWTPSLQRDKLQACNAAESMTIASGTLNACRFALRFLSGILAVGGEADLIMVPEGWRAAMYPEKGMLTCAYGAYLEVWL